VGVKKWDRSGEGGAGHGCVELGYIGGMGGVGVIDINYF
jgi:hypothetical protein